MVNVFNELAVSEASVEGQLIDWKHDTRGIFNSFKNFSGVGLFIRNIDCLWSGKDINLKSFDFI